MTREYTPTAFRNAAKNMRINADIHNSNSDFDSEKTCRQIADLYDRRARDIEESGEDRGPLFPRSDDNEEDWL